QRSRSSLRGPSRLGGGRPNSHARGLRSCCRPAVCVRDSGEGERRAVTNRAYHNTRVLVLGASGFIGAWVARGLCAAGAELFVSARNAQRAQLALSRFSVQGEFVEVDVCDERAVQHLLQTVQPTITFNL